MNLCRLLGHRYRFSTKGSDMTWYCERGCGAGGEKSYDSPELARSYAAAFDKQDSAALGKRAPLIGLAPLRLYRWWKRRHREQA